MSTQTEALPVVAAEQRVEPQPHVQAFGHHRPALWSVIAIAAGAGLATQGRINGELGVRLEHGMLAAFLSFALGFVLLAVVLAFSKRDRLAVVKLVASIRDGSMPWWYLSTGLIGAFLVATQGLVIGTIGVALFTVGVVAGQTLSGLVVDRIGFGGLARKQVTAPRMIGAFLAMVAVGLALVGTGQLNGVWLIVLPFIAGLLQSLQQALGGRVQRQSGSAIAQAAQTFAVGTLALGAVVLVQALVGVTAQPLPAESWLYLGGALGVLFVALTSVAVHHLGVLTVGLAAICGQVLASVVLDLLFPAGQPVTVWSLLGAALTVVAVAVSGIRGRGRSAVAA
ncbi:DMT family transporter [Agrococcus sp. Marseille-Q4369]|uniref:DMT family transporter n=1 Tax=Agrococcus sp. Marseille-Q4369 TaxID=2810513 RepID=UPI001B8B3AFA|nr:DMT family transporter [Agrococcus sp. Marseille-Q4369]QUW17835.1 DMT family transporter [Agrococcus sp. Marseille-Q4369]